jgi:hypothetical protein
MANKLKGKVKRIIHLDHYGHHEDGHFNVRNVPTSKSGTLYEGAPNLEDKDILALNLSLLIVLRPDVELWQAIQTMKYEDGVKKKLPQAWLDGWKDKSSWNQKQINAYIDETMDVILAQFPKVMVTNFPVSQEGSVTKGWESITRGEEPKTN